MGANITYERDDDRPLSALVIAADAAARDLAREALDAAGARRIHIVEPAEAHAALDERFAIVLLEAQALDDLTLDGLLPRIDARARETDARVIVVLGTAQIDHVSRHLLGRNVQLLSEPDATQRLLAVLITRSPASANVGDNNREAERLRQMNEEVARIAEALARLAQRGASGASESESGNVVGDRRPGYRAAEIVPGAIVQARDLRDAIRSRRMRDQYLPGGLFEDPAWDMLLDLLAADLEGARVSVSSLCIAAAVAPTTALRWIGRMTEAGMFGRVPDPDDRRRAFVTFAGPTRQALLDYCTAAKRQGLPIA